MPDKEIEIISQNKKAFHDYTIIDGMEAGIVLTGSEIKSVRASRVQLREAYVRIEKGQAWLYNADIAQWSGASRNNHAPTRPRKLLMHKAQIADWASRVDQKGLTIVPIKMYLKGHYAKVDIALAKGKQQADKRESIRRRDVEREMQQALKTRR